MQTIPSQSDVILTWSLQSALSGGLAVACIGLALTFGRPAMRVLAANFILACLASVVIWVSLGARSLGLEPPAGSYLAAFSLPLSPLLTFVLMLHLIRLLAGRVTRALPATRVLAATAGGGLAVSLTVAWATSRGPDGSPAIVAVMGSVAAIASYAVLAIVALRSRADAPEHRNALGFLGASFVVLTLRSTTNIIVAVASVASGTPPHFSLSVTVVQLFLLVVAGVLQIIAVLDDERVSIVKTAEQLRNAELAMARSLRLESLGRMAGAVAHDFNNLLTVISISAQAARGTVTGGADDDLRMIDASAKRGQDLTRQLLAFARQEPQEITRFDVNRQIEGMSGLLRRIMGKQAVLTVQLAASPQMVAMDMTQFEQVTMNLVVNARDAMPLGGSITLSVALGAGADATFVRVAVEDTGTGIPAEVLPHIFEPFYSTKTAGEGTGLGLATCDAIVRRSGGRIDVSTETGKGTRFDIFLPKVGAA